MKDITHWIIIILLAVIAVIMLLQYQESRERSPAENAAHHFEKAVDEVQKAMGHEEAE